MNNIRVKGIALLFLFVLSSLLISLMPHKGRLGDSFSFCFMGGDSIKEESFRKRFLVDARGRLLSCAYHLRVNPDERLAVVDDAETARKIAVVLLDAKILPRVEYKDLKAELLGEDVWRVYKRNKLQASPVIYIQREDAKVLRMVAEEDINQKYSFSPENRWLYYSDSTVESKGSLIDTPEMAYKIGSVIIASAYGQNELRQKPYLVSLINGCVWLIRGNANAGTGIGNVGYIYLYKKNGMALKMYHTK